MESLCINTQDLTRWTRSTLTHVRVKFLVEPACVQVCVYTLYCIHVHTCTAVNLPDVECGVETQNQCNQDLK